MQHKNQKVPHLPATPPPLNPTLAEETINRAARHTRHLLTCSRWMGRTLTVLMLTGIMAALANVDGPGHPFTALKFSSRLLALSPLLLLFVAWIVA